MTDKGAQAAKESAAKSGIAAGTLLAAIELFGGILSGSLGLLSSAVNTVMDLTAAIIAFFAVREGGKPPDEAHLYGHEKVEAFAAIAEILLLYVVCAWLVWTAIVRLMSGTASVEFFWVALGTNFASIAIDAYAFTRFRSTAKKHGSEALGAGALHFLNDLLIALVVIAGLSLYSFGLWYGDPIAALCVVAITLYSSLDVMRNAVGVLMDTAPRGAVERLRAQILSVEGVEGCHSLRVRRVGSKYFVDAHVEIKGHLPLSQAHTITEAIEAEIAKAFPDSDVMIHTEPLSDGDPIAQIREIVAEFPAIKGAHEVIVNAIGGSIFISYHLEMETDTSLEDAHGMAHRLEERVKEAFGAKAAIISHLEPTIELSSESRLTPKEMGDLRAKIVRVAEGYPEIRSAHEISSMRAGSMLCITLHCEVDGTLPLDQAHALATSLEERIKSVDGRIGHVIVHCEPQNAPA
jgi:cation diffusion facilitator family transporter